MTAKHNFAWLPACVLWPPTRVQRFDMLKVVVNGEEFFFSDSSLHSMDYVVNVYSLNLCG